MAKMSLLHHYDVMHAPTAYKSTSNLAQSLQSAMKPISPAQQDQGLISRAMKSLEFGYDFFFDLWPSRISKNCDPS